MPDTRVPFLSQAPVLLPPAPPRRRPLAAPPAAVLFALLCGSSVAAMAQAVPPAGSTPGDLQVGGGYTRANPDYSPDAFNGFAVFADIDFTRYLGAVGEFHRISGASSISETTYAGGARIRYPIRHFEPYLKIVGGAGSFSFQQSTSAASSQNGTYAVFAGGGGLDYRIRQHILLRADYEYQRWRSFPPTGLQPNLFTLGALYRFH